MPTRFAALVLGLSTIVFPFAAAAKGKLTDAKPGAPLDADSGVPFYCDPGEPYDYNMMWWSDQTDICQFNSYAKYCCVAITSGGLCDANYDNTLPDLEGAMAMEAPRDHWYDYSQVGSWGVGNVANAIHHSQKASTDVLTTWFHSLNDYRDDPESQGKLGFIGRVWFNALTEDGDWVTKVADYHC